MSFNSAIKSACIYAFECEQAARKIICDAVRYALDNDEPIEIYDLIHESIDNMQCIIYTARARVLCLGSTFEDEAREELEDSSPEAVAFFCLSRAMSDKLFNLIAACDDDDQDEIKAELIRLGA